MKKLEPKEMQLIAAEGWFTSFIGGVCAGWGAAQIINLIAYSNPITGTAATVMNVGCTVFAIGGGYS